MRLLMILVPDERPGGGAPSLPLDRFAGPYYVFRDAGAEVVLASAGGGAPRIASGQDRDPSPAVRRFRQDRRAQDEAADTLDLDQVHPGDFDGAFCIGPVGSVWRPGARDPTPALISALLSAGKPVALLSPAPDLAPRGAGEGLIIAGDSPEAALPAAEALLGAIREYLRPPPV